MTDKTEAQPEALPDLDIDTAGHSGIRIRGYSVERVKSLHAEIQQLKAQLSARQAAPDWIEELAQSWDECMYDAPGEMIDIGASIRKAASRATPPPPEREPLKGDTNDNP